MNPKHLSRFTRNLLVINISILYSVHCYARQSKIDSLLTVLKTAKEDTNKVNQLNSLSWEYINTGSYDTALRYSNEALRLGVKINFKKGISFSYNTTGVAYFYQANYPKTLENWFSALKGFEEINDKGGIATALGNIGNVYLMQPDNPKALEYYFKALKVNEELGKKSGIAINLGNIGSIYVAQGDYAKGLDYELRALKISEELGNKNRIALWLGNIGKLYYDQGNSFKSNPSKRDSLFDFASEYYFKALKMFEEIGANNFVLVSLGNIGSLYLEQGKYKQAGEYLLKSLAMAKEINSLDDIKDAHKNLSELYTKMGDYKSAYENYQQYSLFKDSIFNTESSDKIANMQFKYEQDKKDKIIELETKGKEQQHQAEVKQQKIIIYSVSIGLGLVILLAFFIFRGYKQKQKANIEISEQKHIIEEKNKDITDSINYARRIQKAMLPHRKDIWTAFPQSFVLFKPKDIVSGDFYFFHKNGQTVFIASADCTGHGVPGAFMSMIGAGKLNDAVAQSADTSVILSLLNKGVKTALKQSETDETATRDGMDIALCSVDTNTRIVKYAGANRPIWIIRIGQTAVEEIKATKKAIGGFTEDNQHFDSHEIQFEKGDTFYISTDGFADTFGGEEEKKVTTKRFKEILVSIQDKTMKEQEHHLDNFIETWKGSTEQIDDILVIGVRL